MCPRIVYVAPSASPLLQDAGEVLVFLTWKATGSSTALCAAAGVAPWARRMPLETAAERTAAKNRPQVRRRAFGPRACSKARVGRFFIRALLQCELHSAAISLLYQIYVYSSRWTATRTPTTGSDPP